MQRSLPSGDTERRLDLLQGAVSLVLINDPAAAFRNVQKNFDDVEDDRTARHGSAPRNAVCPLPFGGRSRPWP